LFKHLIRVDAIKEADNNLKINFTFSENEWFTNTILTKEFELEGDEIKRSFGGDINWKEGKNITVKIVKKKGKKGKKTTQK
jgi:nucleosome assembly protein 1-like 1